MIMLQLAKNAGASKVILSEPVEEKRELALKLGATKVINPMEEDVKAVLDEYCENVDVVIECVGNIHTQEDAIQFAGKAATVMFSYINPYTFERAISVLESKTIDLESLITNIVPLDDIVDVFTKPEYRRTGKVMIQVS